MLEKIERIIIAVLVLFLLAGIGYALYRQSRPVAVRLAKFDPDSLRRSAPEEHARTRININIADADELATLKGVGKALAGRIVAYRSANGFFLSVEDIKKVKGIGDALFEKIKNDITTQ